MKELHERFWNASIEELKTGIQYDQGNQGYVCLVCGEFFEDGVIYPYKDQLFTAKRITEIHVDNQHQGMVSYLLSLDKKWTGLSDLQKQYLELFYQGMNDQEIAKQLSVTTSTIRNYRFTLREKAKQAKLFLTLMDFVENQTEQKQRYVSMHRTAKMVDERYAITEKEREEIIKKYFPEGPEGKMKEFPKKEKRKIVLLNELIKRFDRQKKYSEAEVNDVLKTAFHDFVTLRRYLIEYGYMDREQDGSLYWVKG